MPSARVRFAAEAVFLLVVAGGAVLAKLSPLQIILLMFVAWVLVALIERASSRAQSRASAAPLQEASAPPAAELPGLEPPVATGGRLWRGRRRKAAEPLAAPTAPLEERPSRTHVRRLEPEPEMPQADQELAEILGAETTAPGPVVTKRAFDLSGLEEPEAAPVPEPAPPAPEAPASAPEQVAEAQPESPRVEQPPAEPAPVPSAEHRPPPAPREWNLWDLERRARERAGDPARDEEWTALFVHLRQFANSDGQLPKEFDDLVRESFAELIQAA